MFTKIIVDADFCIKLGGSNDFHFLSEVLPLIATEIYMHKKAYSEVLYPESAKVQLDELVDAKKVILVDEESLSAADRAIYDMSYQALAKCLLSPLKPSKNKGEVSSLAYAKAKRIPILATDESYLQGVIDSQLNTGIDDISCLRIRNVVEMIRDGDITLPRKYAKALWRISYNLGNVTNANEIFDRDIWPLK